MRWIVALSPFLHLLLMHAAWLTARSIAGHAPDANKLNIGQIWGGSAGWIGLALQLTMIIGLPMAISWAVRQKEWRWLGVISAGWALWIAVIAWDPLGARAWYFY